MLIWFKIFFTNSEMFGWLRRNLYKNVDLIQDIFYKFRNVWLAKNFLKFSDILIEALQDWLTSIARNSNFYNEALQARCYLYHDQH